MFMAPNNVQICRITSKALVFPLFGSPLNSTVTAFVRDTNEEGISEIRNTSVIAMSVIVKLL